MLAPPGYFEGEPAVNRGPALPERSPLTYRIVHRAILAGWVRAAHDLSEGGLAVAAAEMALAGRVGLSLALDALHPNPRLALFAETNGCLLLEVAPLNSEEFEASFYALGGAQSLPYLRLGMVTPEPEFVIASRGEQILHLPIGDLVAAFHCAD
jgi:hydrogenase maturation factor